MAKYPQQTCRDCNLARWTWSDKEYKDGKKRIIVQRPGVCLADDSSASRAGQAHCLKAMEPYLNCTAWVAEKI